MTKVELGMDGSKKAVAGGTKKNCYQIILQGQGDTMILFVDQETWDWINNEEAAIPEKQIEIFMNTSFGGESPSREEALEALSEWDGSSPENDRALLACNSDETFFSTTEAMSFAKKNKLNIVNQFVGVIY